MTYTRGVDNRGHVHPHAADEPQPAKANMQVEREFLYPRHETHTARGWTRPPLSTPPAIPRAAGDRRHFEQQNVRAVEAADHLTRWTCTGAPVPCRCLRGGRPASGLFREFPEKRLTRARASAVRALSVPTPSVPAGQGLGLRYALASAR